MLKTYHSDAVLVLKKSLTHKLPASNIASCHATPLDASPNLRSPKPTVAQTGQGTTNHSSLTMPHALPSKQMWRGTPAKAAQPPGPTCRGHASPRQRPTLRDEGVLCHSENQLDGLADAAVLSFESRAHSNRRAWRGTQARLPHPSPCSTLVVQLRRFPIPFTKACYKHNRGVLSECGEYRGSKETVGLGRVGDSTRPLWHPRGRSGWCMLGQLGAGAWHGQSHFALFASL